MSRTKKDLRSHKKGYGQHGMGKPKRRLTPLAKSASKIAGKNTQLIFTENDIKQDDYYLDERNKDKSYWHTHWHNAKSVRSIRKSLRKDRKMEKSSARNRMKQQLKKELKNHDNQN